MQKIFPHKKQNTVFAAFTLTIPVISATLQKLGTKIKLQNFHKNKSLHIISLLFITLLLFSPLTTLFNVVSPFANAITVTDDISLKNTINNAVGPTIITLTQDIYLTGTEPLVIPEGANITLESDKTDSFWKLVGINNKSTINVLGKLTIKGIIVTHLTGDFGRGVNVASTGEFYMYSGAISNNTNIDIGFGGGVSVNGTFTMYGGVISGNSIRDCGGGVYVYEDGVFTMYGGEIRENSIITIRGGGVSNSGVFTMYDGEISHNIAGSPGGAGGVSNDYGTFIMYGGKIANNTSVNSAGGVMNFHGDFTMVGGVIANNTATNGGGVVNAYSNNFTMTGGVISDNIAKSSGGGVLNFLDSNFTMSGGEISNNIAALYGGGVHNSDFGNFSLSGGVISDNHASLYGGGVSNSNGYFVVYNGEISNNTAYCGGGVYNFNYYNITMFGGEISNNMAYSGGGVYNSNTFRMFGGEISNNMATVNGGGVYLSVTGFFTMFGGEISHNTALTGNGGGVWLSNANTGFNKLFVDEGVVFSGNTAVEAYNRSPVHDEVYSEQIKGIVWSIPFTQGYNNYDISYTNDVLLKIFTVTVQNSYAEITGAGNYIEGTTVTINAGTRSNYNFAGWTIMIGHIQLNNPQTPKTTFIMPAEDVTITATWAQNAYNIYYQLDGGTNHPDNPTTYTTNNLPITINNPTKEGYTFFDWIIFYADGHVDRLPTHTIPIGTTGDITLIAHWTTTPYIITYQLDGGTNHPSNPSTYTVNDLPIAISNPTKQGYTFTGWTITTTDGITKPLPDEGIIVGTTGDLVLTAYWEFAKDFTVTYDANGGSGDVPVDNNRYSPGDSVVVLPSDLSRLGYVFGGWLYDDTIYDAGGVFLMPAMDVVLVAVWEPVEYVVTYAPGAQGTFTAQVYGGLVYGDATPGFVGVVSGNAGYVFVGWSPVVSLLVTGSVTYVAQWEREGSGGGSGGNGGNGGSGGSGGGGGSGGLLVVQFVDWDGAVLKVERVRFGGSATAPVVHVREGFVFIGWDKEFSNVRSNLIVTAQYAPTKNIEPPISPQVEDVRMWALANLIISVTGIILSVILAICALLWHKQNQYDEQKHKKSTVITSQQSIEKHKNGVKETKIKQKQRRLLCLLSGIVMGILGIIVFILTEDMNLPMQIFDKWTIVNVVIFVIEVIVTILTFKRKKVNYVKDEQKEDFIFSDSTADNL
ncbi:MAG: InlB B-repeat-containing protein [Candidatus Bathyarchaeota archaeon]|nr:InlB B-repeat-containing protein [Candidatus Termiticorpusculum sp.]